MVLSEVSCVVGARRHEAAGAPFVVVLASARRRAARDLGHGLRSDLGGVVLATRWGTIGQDGQALVSFGELPARLPAGLEAFAELHVFGPRGSRSSEPVRIRTR